MSENDTLVEGEETSVGLTRYMVIAEPPLLGCVQVTKDRPFVDATADTPTGTSGIVAGIAAAEAAEAAETPLAFVAVTVNK